MVAKNQEIASRMFDDGRLVGHYEIVGHLGSGGMGEVYRARDTILGRDVAIKVLNAKLAQDLSSLSRFMREAKAASSLNHPNILVIHEISDNDGSPYIVSELIEGLTLREMISRKEQRARAEWLDIAMQIASALSAAHEAQIVHRDIKPENIMIRPDGYVKILDFGLAKLVGSINPAAKREDETAPGMIMGTVNYMSPEQAKGEQIDERTDIFSLGVVLFEMMAGRPPFRGQTLAETLANLLRQDPPLLSELEATLPPALCTMVDRALRKDRNERYQTMNELFSDLKRVKKAADLAEEIEGSRSQDETQKLTTQIFQSKKSELTVNENAIAVLPFVNLSSEADNEYFCDGLAEELLSSLSKIKDLKVAARSSAFSFKGKGADLSEIAGTLRVHKVIEGSVRRIGNRMRITIQLVNADDGYHVWSERYDTQVEDIFAVQDEITLAVIDALKVKLLNADKQALLERYSPDMKAYEYLLRGNYNFEKRNLSPTSEIEVAIEMFKKAIETDPNYALAHARLAFAYVWKAIYNDAGNPIWIEKCRESLAHAEQLDHDLPQNFEVRNQIAWSKYGNFDIAAGVDQIRRAREFNPRAGHCELAILAFHAGMKDVAVRELRLARELDPASDFLKLASVDAYALLGLYDEAIEIGRPFGCDAMGFTHALIKRGLFDEANTALGGALARAPDNPRRLGEKVILLAAQGKFDEAEELIPVIAKQITISQAYHHVTYDFACAYALNGNVEDAVKWLHETADTGMPIYPLFSTDTHLDKIRQDPQFIGFLEKSKVVWDELKQSFDWLNE